MNLQTRLPTLLVAAAAALLVAACGNNNDKRTAGQKMDGAIADAKSAGAEVRNETKQAANSVVDSAKDAMITTKVNAALAADDKLSALRIDVDTKSGHVSLSGTAPDAASRDRAATLTRAIEGVVAVDNKLAVDAKG
jgi:hyperosmotically inducible periplasmic protein